MSRLTQFYEPPGAPIAITGAPDDVLHPWLQHRARLRSWLSDLPDDQWSHPTRCEAWDVRELVQHLATVTQFFSYTVHQSRKGIATRALEGFDPGVTPDELIRPLADVDPAATLATFVAEDDRLAAELEVLDADGWNAPAEAPPGMVSVRCTMSHALFDSWIHERDFLVARGDEPPSDPDEVATTGRYLLTLAAWATVATGGPKALDIRLSDPDVRLATEVVDRVITGSIGPARADAARVEGRAADVLDLVTGRTPAGDVIGDPDAIAGLRRFSDIMG